MKFSKRNALFLLAIVVTALSVFACASQQSAETKPANNGTATQKAAAHQQNPAVQPNQPAQPGQPAEQNAGTQPNTISMEPEIDISLPESASSAAVGSTVNIPIVVSSKSGKEIFSYSLAIMFDPKVLQPTGEPVSTTSTLSDGFMVASDTKTTGRLGVAAASAGKTIKANGTLLNTHFKVIGKVSGKMDLKIAQPTFEDPNGNKINVNAAMKQ